MVGADIGSTEVRVVQVEGLDRHGQAIVTRVGQAPVKEGAIVQGQIRNQQLLSLALTRAAKEAAVPLRGMVVGLSTPDTAVTQLVLPSAVRRSERVGAIRNLGKDISAAVPLSDAELATCLIDTDLSSEGTQVNTLSVVAASSAQMDELLAICRIAKVTPRAIDLSGAALLRALIRSPLDSVDVSTLVDVGATKTTVVTRQGLYLRSLRTLPEGGLSLTRALMSAMSSSATETAELREQAERDKRNYHLGVRPEVKLASGHSYVDDRGTFGIADSLAQTGIEEALNRAGEQLVENIAAAVDQDSAAFADRTQGATLCGGSALMPGLKEMLASRMGIPVQIGRPWATLARNRNTEHFFRSGGEPPELMLKLSVAIGLALWEDPA